MRFRRVRFQTPDSVSFSGLTEFRGANSLSSSQPIICVPKQTHRVFRRTHRVCRGTQWVLSSETVLSKQYSATVSYKRRLQDAVLHQARLRPGCTSAKLKESLRVGVKANADALALSATVTPYNWNWGGGPSILRACYRAQKTLESWNPEKTRKNTKK